MLLRKAMLGNAIHVGLWTLICGGSHVDAATAPQNERLARFYLAGMQDVSDQMRVGHVVCTGTRFGRDLTAEKTGPRLSEILRRSPFTIELFFEGSRLRFDRREGDATGSVIVEEDSVTTYRSTEHVVKSGEATAYTRRIAPFDVRLLGQMSWADLERGQSAKSLENLLKSAEIAEVAESGNVCDISWIYSIASPASEVKQMIRIDGRNGFTPVLLEERVRPAGSEVDWNQIPLIGRAEVKWRQLNGIWVPIASRMFIAYGSEEVELELNWRSINGEIPAKEFTVAGIEAPAGTYVVDERLGVPIVESVIGGTRQPDQNSSNWIQFLLIGINVVLILSLVFWIRRRMNSRMG